MRKSLLAAAVVAVLGAAGLAPASAAPGLIGAAEPATTLVDVRMHRHGMHRGHHMRHHRMRHRHHMRHHHHRGHGMHRHRGHRM